MTMRERKAPRYQGKITSWKDEQGFGFITPNGGGPSVFVHIKSFSLPGSRPGDGKIVTYELTTNEQGKPRAENVAFVGAPRRESAPKQTSALIVAAGFLVFIGLLYQTGKLPITILALYLGASVLTVVAYSLDKSAARNNRWRIQEDTLHLLALTGGWPGALVAQQLMRHKTKKTSFRVIFWVTVIANCGALGWLLSPSGAEVFLDVMSAI